MISHKWSPMKRLIWLRGSGITGGSATWETITGNPVSFSAKAAPLRQLKVAFSPKQEGTGDPSPDNVRPISGWSSLNVEQRGKNLLNYADYSDSSRITSVVDNGDGSFTVTASEAQAAIYHKIPVIAGETYTIKYAGTRLDSGNASQIGVVTVYDGDNVSAPLLLNGVSADVSPKYFTPTGNVALVRCHVTGGLGAGVGTVINPQLELGSTASAYVPYNPSSRSISISLGSTVYSGTVDVVTGVGEITGKKYVFTGNELWTYVTASDFWYFAYAIDQSISNYEANTTSIGVKVHTFNSSNIVRVYCSENPNVVKPDTDMNALFGAGIDLFYYLYTPIPIQLTPQEINSLAGDNVLFSDANGNLTVEYRSN